MKLFTCSLPIALLAVVLASCTSEPQTQNSDAAPADMAHNSRNSLDWPGTYKGIAPCGDCEGIETAVTLYEDGNYRRNVRYLGKTENNFFSEEGQYTWNEAGSDITLQFKDGGKQAYQVGEGALFHLDQEGKRIEGDLAEAYRYAKNHGDPRVEGKKWVLVELKGKEVKTKEGEKQAFLMLHPVDGRVSGSDGCNNMMGGYELMEGDRISFGQMAGTMMACADMKTPQEVAKAVQEADNYNVNDSLLTLNKAGMEPLARFARMND